MITRIMACLLLGTMAASCRPSMAEDDELEAPEPAGQLSPVSGQRPLAELLAVLQAQIDSALAVGSEEDVHRHVLRAEAITDQLLEAREPFAWLAGGYSLEARLRQLQAMADRVTAQLRRDRIPGLTSTPTISQADVQMFRNSVAALREDLQRGGGPAPPSLDTLLARAARGETEGTRPGSSGPAPAAATEPEPVEADLEPAVEPEPAGGPLLGEPVRDPDPPPPE